MAELDHAHFFASDESAQSNFLRNRTKNNLGRRSSPTTPPSPVLDSSEKASVASPIFLDGTNHYHDDQAGQMRSRKQLEFSKLASNNSEEESCVLNDPVPTGWSTGQFVKKYSDPDKVAPDPADDVVEDQFTERSSLSASTAPSSITTGRAQETVRRYIRQLGMFIPGRIVKWHIERGYELSHKVSHQMFHEQFDGAVLFVDISGFSFLAEELEQSQRVSVAAQQLSTEVGAALGPLVKIILEWGGDVIKFAGDAILAVFDSLSHGNMENAVAAACLAARKMVKFSLSNATSGVRLCVHCGVGAGSIVGLHVGGVLNRWEYAVTGEPVKQATEAEGVAKSGEVVVSGKVLECVSHFTESTTTEKPGNFKLVSMLGEELGGTEIRTKRLWDELHKLDSATLHAIYMHIIPYVPRPVIQSLDNGHGAWLADVRMVVTMFIQLKDLPHETVDDVPRIHNVIRLVQRQVYGYNGSTLCRVIIDDKGLSTLWAFGMPPYDINENFAFRAVLAGMALHESLVNRGLNCAVGITAGRVFCGTVGGNQRSEYTLHGTQVNLAARLMSQAVSGVLCDDIVHRVTSDLIVYEDPVVLSVKGKSHEIEAFRPVEALPSSLDSVVDSCSRPLRVEKPASSFSTLYRRAQRAKNVDGHVTEQTPRKHSTPTAERKHSNTGTPTGARRGQRTPTPVDSRTIGEMSVDSTSTTPTRPPVISKSPRLQQAKRNESFASSLDSPKFRHRRSRGGRSASHLSASGSSSPALSHRSFMRLGRHAVAKNCVQCHKPTSKPDRLNCKHCGSVDFVAAAPPASPGGSGGGERVSARDVKRCAACGKGCRNKRKDNCAYCGARRWVPVDFSDDDSP